mgnify:CR=1 FL=1
MVFQMPMESFDPRCTLGDGIGESLRNMGISRTETRRKVEELLERCGLEKEYADRYPQIYPVSEVYQTGQQIEQKCLKRFYS